MLTQILVTSIASIMKNTKDTARKYECEVCQKKFMGKNDLRKHFRTHTNERPYVCSECGQGFKQSISLKNHIACKHSAALQSKEIFICSICEKVFPIKERLKLHMRTHTGDKPYECEYCNKKFARGGQLLQHLRTHTGSKPYECKICNATFTCGANLKLHMNRHMEIRNFVCDICGKSFFRRDALKKHLNCTHGNIRAFHCNICNKELKGHLPQHMRTHQKDRPHGCADCGATFTQRSHLIVHQRVHSGEKPYRCEVCWKAFAHSTALKLHTRRHTGEKPFACVLCNTSFTQLPHLKKHMLCIHNSNKPYVCSHCKSFHKTKNDLEIHYASCKASKKTRKVEMPTNDKVEPPMPIEKMRLLLAILLKRISTPEKLSELGFNKILIDDVLSASIQSSGREPCKDLTLSTAERLTKNVAILLEWTVPKTYMEKFKGERRSTEELLEELTS